MPAGPRGQAGPGTAVGPPSQLPSEAGAAQGAAETTRQRAFPGQARPAAGARTGETEAGVFLQRPRVSWPGAVGAALGRTGWRPGGSRPPAGRPGAPAHPVCHGACSRLDRGSSRRRPSRHPRSPRGAASDAAGGRLSEGGSRPAWQETSHHHPARSSDLGALWGPRPSAGPPQAEGLPPGARMGSPGKHRPPCRPGWLRSLESQPGRGWQPSENFHEDRD